MLKIELKKVFVKKGFIFIVLFFLLFEIGGSIFSLNGLFETKRDRERYLQFIGTYGGVVSDEKKEQIEHEYELYNGANGSKEDLREKLERGIINQEEYNVQSELIKEYLSGQGIFTEFYEESEYSFDDTENRQIVSAKIWRWLFGDEKVDFFFIVTVIICVLISVISENESSFAEIKNTCKNGKEKLYRFDINFCFIFVGLTSLLLSILRFFLARAYLGDADFSASLQSFSLFENSKYDISLLQGFFIISLLKMLGGIAFAAMSIIAGYFLKSSLSVLLFSFFATIFPPYIFSSPALYYISPVSLLISNGFFFGDVVLSGDDVGGSIVYSTSVSIVALIISVLFALCLIISSYKFSKRRLN